MKRTTALRALQVSATGEGLVSRGGLALLGETARVAGLEPALRTALAPWRRARVVHDPARVVLQLGYALAAGGDCLADIGMLRDACAIVGAVPSDPTVSRVIADLGRWWAGRAGRDRRRARRGPGSGACLAADRATSAGMGWWRWTSTPR